MNPRVLLYAKNDESIIKNIVDSILEQGFVPVVIDDGSDDSTLEILKTYYDEIDIIHFEESRGFYQTMLSGFRHIVRGSDANAIIVFKVGEDNPFYIKQLMQVFEKNSKDICIFHRLNNVSSFFPRMVQHMYTFLSWFFYGFESKDPLNTYAVFSRRIIKTIVEQVSVKKTILLTDMYIYAARNDEFSYEWIPVDEERNDSFEQSIKVLSALF